MLRRVKAAVEAVIARLVSLADSATILNDIASSTDDRSKNRNRLESTIDKMTRDRDEILENMGRLLAKARKAGQKNAS
jgi:prefoldin subunit 5